MAVVSRGRLTEGNMMRRYSNRELAQLWDRKDWATLWPIMVPMVKHAVRRCMQRGLDPYYVRDDLMQEAYLAAWKALPKWNAFESSLQRWIEEKVRSAVLDANRREAGGMVGGRDSAALVVSMHGETAEDDISSNDEQGLCDGIEASLTYGDDSPEGFWDPADERLFGEQDLAAVPAKYRDMVRRLAGIGVPQESDAEYAAAEGISRMTAWRRIERLRRYLLQKSTNPRNKRYDGHRVK